jgi:hypothetical protein
MPWILKKQLNRKTISFIANSKNKMTRQNYILTTIQLKHSTSMWLGSVQNFCSHFDKHMSDLYPDIRPWCKQLKA